jgi:hypothetical protein
MLVQDFFEGMVVVDSGSMVSYFWKRLFVSARRGSQAGSLCLSCDVDVKDMMLIQSGGVERKVMLQYEQLVNCFLERPSK